MTELPGGRWAPFDLDSTRHDCRPAAVAEPPLSVLRPADASLPPGPVIGVRPQRSHARRWPLFGGAAVGIDVAWLVAMGDGGDASRTPAVGSRARPTAIAVRDRAPVLRATAAPLPLGGSAGGDCNCGNFATEAGAQAFFEAQGGPALHQHGLDGDGTGRACQSLP